MIRRDRAIDVFDKYVADVLEGRIVVGQHVRNAVQRHAKDIERQGTDGFLCVFDRSKADRAIGCFPLIFRHTKDKWAGQPYVLTPFQTFIVGSIFGWRWEDGRRRFRKAYCSMARKQGKSTIAAGIAILLAGFDGVIAAEVYLTATKIEQTGPVFHEAKRMVDYSPILSAFSDVKTNKIILRPKGHIVDSVIRPLGSDKPFSGLSPNAVVVDELHEWKERHRDFLSTMNTGFGARQQPLQFFATTAGDAKSYLWKEEESYAKRVAAGAVEDDSYFAFIAAMDPEDDILDEANWPKSMPNLGITVSPEAIRQEAAVAAVRPEKMIEFKRFYANMEVTSSVQAIDPEDWKACKVDQLSDWSLAEAICGAIDMGGRNDLAAFSLVAKFPDGLTEEGRPNWRYEVRAWSWIDSDTERDLSLMPWVQYLRLGSLIATPTVCAALRDRVVEESLANYCRQIGYDPMNMQHMAEELTQEGFEMVKITQGRYMMHEPLTLFIDLVRQRKIAHDGTQPVLDWCLGNLVINGDHANRYMPDRKNSADKIDAVVATIMALRLASLAPARPRGPAFIY